VLRKSRAKVAGILAAVAWLGCRAAPGGQEPDYDITASDMRARIHFLASDQLEGRGTPSRGLDVAAGYIRSEFSRVGLDAPRGGYIQRYQLAMTEMGGGWSLALSRGNRRADLRHQRDFWGLPWAAGTVDGALTFVGDRPPEGTVEDGVATIWVARLSPGAMPREWLIAATRAGAVGLVFVLPPELEFQMRNWLGEGDAVYELGDVEPSLPAALVSEEALAGALEQLGLGAQTVAARPDGAPSGVRAQLSGDLALETLGAPNVIGVVRGSDPALRDEYVLVSAHMDGLGIGRPVDGDSIYNGADDNASGTAAVLEVAEAIAALDEKPKRSFIFLAVSGEEKGLLGSAWFVDHSPIPLERVIANLNIDMIGRNWEDTISVIGKPFSSLGNLVDSVAVAHPELGLAVEGDLWPEEGFFYRSDHFNFARKGIPAVFFFNGVHEDYHRPSDEPDKIEFGKAARVARLVLEVALALANAEDRPRWEPAARDAIVEGAR
jgi:hypothetical protein